MTAAAIIHNLSFPEGSAPVVRFTAYAKGLQRAGWQVRVLCIKPKDESRESRGLVTAGEYQGLPFEFTSGTRYRSPGIATRVWFNMLGFWKSLARIAQMKRREGLKVALMVGPLGFFKETMYFIVCRLYGVKLVEERTEYPFLSPGKSPLFRLKLWLYLHVSCRQYDGMLVISKVLEGYFRKYIRPGAGIFVMPIIVEPERFDLVAAGEQEFEDVVYIGSMQTGKDGVEFLLEAFARIAGKYGKLRLVLIGNTAFDGFIRLQQQVEALQIGNRVVFTGRMPVADIPLPLKNAKMLVLARPANKQAEAGMPTKVGEYLATGNPVVVTKVGSIPDYLEDGVNAFLAEPGDVAGFADKMEEILLHPDKAKVVGERGKELARSVFNYTYQGARLASFFHSL